MSTSCRVPLAAYPGFNPFVASWLAGEARATSLLPRGPLPGTPQSRGAFDPELAAALVRSNARWGIDADGQIAEWSKGGTVSIVAGQQVGFAGGPLYTLAKLATVVRMKRDLERKGVRATAFFWLATEDHDFDEVATLQLPVSAIAAERDVNRQLDLVRLRAPRTADPRTAVGALPVPGQLTEELVSLLGVERPAWLRDGITFRDSFAELIRSVFGSEVLLVDALLPELRRAGAPLFERIRRNEREIQAALQERSTAIEAAGFREQVVARDGESYTLFFALDDEGRRVTASDGTAAERTSTSAITRPLLQDFVLRPDVFVGGPAEVAYYAQLSALHGMLDVALPRVALRGHVLAGPEHIIRAFGRFGIDPRYAFTSPDAMAAALEPAATSRIRETAAAAETQLRAQIDEITALALPADHSLAGSIQRSIGHLQYHFGKLTERAIKAVARRERERWNALRALAATLYPDRHVQDRVVSWLPSWLAYGARLPERLIEEIEPDSDHFRIIGL